MKLEEKQLSSQLVFQGKIITVYNDEVELPDGERATREYVRHPGAVCVVPIDGDGNVIMERQYRYPFAEILEEIPAGKLEKGENPLDGVKRELQEECGVCANKIEFLGTIYTTVAFFDEKIECYLATDLSYGERHLDEDEFLDVFKIPLEDAVSKVMNGQIKDAKTQIALLKADRILKERK